MQAMQNKKYDGKFQRSGEREFHFIAGAMDSFSSCRQKEEKTKKSFQHDRRLPFKNPLNIWKLERGLNKRFYFLFSTISDEKAKKAFDE